MIEPAEATNMRHALNTKFGKDKRLKDWTLESHGVLSCAGRTFTFEELQLVLEMAKPVADQAKKLTVDRRIRELKKELAALEETEQ